MVLLAIRLFLVSKKREENLNFQCKIITFNFVKAVQHISILEKDCIDMVVSDMVTETSFRCLTIMANDS